MYQRLAESLVRPYVYRELPGWGPIYHRLIGSYQRDAQWQRAGTRRIRGKLHGFVMELDLGHWSQRATYFLGRYYDLATQLLCQAVLRPGDRMYDIGANIGMISLLGARIVGPNGRVDAFEPNPACAQKIRATLAENQISNVFVHQVGLADRPGTLTLSIPAINAGEASFAPSQYPASETSRLHVSVQRGDDLLDAGEPPALIKIDVEGFECRVLDGLRETLETAHPVIVTEVVPDHLQRAGSSADELFGRMIESGYTAYPLSTRRTRLSHALHFGQPGSRGAVVGDVAWFHHASHDRLATRLRAAVSATKRAGAG